MSGRAGRLSHAAHLAIAYCTKPNALKKAKVTGHFEREYLCFRRQGKKEWALEGRDGEARAHKNDF